jgi:uncharacterized protein involved in exopolysaccharide biosynthesis
VRGGGSDLLYIDVTSDKAAIAKSVADALAAVLVEQSQKQSGDTAGDFIKGIQTEQVDPINKRLAEIRAESEQLKVTQGGDVAARNVRIADLEDEAKALDDTRKQYTDIISRVRVNQALDQNNLRILSLAALPSAKQAPPILRTSAVAAIVGLLIGVMSVMIIDRRKGARPASIF